MRIFASYLAIERRISKLNKLQKNLDGPGGLEGFNRRDTVFKTSISCLYAAIC